MLFLHSLVVFGLLDNSEDTQFTFKFMFICILGDHKLHFIPALIGPFLEVTLIPQPDLRNVMIPIFHDMMDWEQRRSGNFKQVLCVKLFIKQDWITSTSRVLMDLNLEFHWCFKVEKVSTSLPVGEGLQRLLFFLSEIRDFRNSKILQLILSC